MTAFTDVLAAHRFREQDHGTIAYRAHCYCGWWEHTNGKREIDVHAAHVEEVLGAADLTVVELPKPDEDTGVFDAGCGAIAHAAGGDVRIHSLGDTQVYRSPRMARVMAAALLATARSVATSPKAGE